MSKPSSGGPKLRRLNMGQLFIILAVVSAVLTVIIFQNVANKGGGTKEVAQVKTKPLVVAAQQLFSGEVITADSVKVIEWPADHYPTSDVYQEYDKLIGRALKQDIYPGQPLFRLNLAGETSKGGLPVVIPPGHRAMTILVTENKGVGGFIKPGDRIDVIGTFDFEFPEATQEALAEQSGPLLEDSFQVSQTVLQNVMVLAIAQEMYEKQNALDEGLKGEGEKTGEGEKPAAASSTPPGEATKGKIVSSITLAVTPEQAEKLAYADSKGDLRLALRPEGENEELHLIGAVGQDVVPLTNLFEKIQKISADLGMSGLSMGNGGDDEIPEDTGSLDTPMEPAGPSVKVFQGTESTDVSF